MNDKEIKRKEYQRQYQRNWMRSRRQEWIMTNGPCKYCGVWDNLEVDHINREDKTMQSSSIWSRRKDVRELELSKCQVLCKQCHLKKTLSEVTYPSIDELHGTSNGYDHHKCRCEKCKLARSKRDLKLRNPNKYKELYNE